jgi:feruloyl-CoA synthase
MDQMVAETYTVFAKPNVAVTTRDNGEQLVRSTHALPDHVLRVTDHLFTSAHRTPEKIFLRERRAGAWASTTYAEAAKAVRALGSEFLRLGLGPQRPVAVLSGNSIAHALVGLAAQSCGVPYTPISPPYSLISEDLAKLRYVLGKTTPGAIFVEQALPFARALTLPECQDAVVFAVDTTGVPRAKSLAAAIATPPLANIDEIMAGVDVDQPIKILFTSGSTGMPKGVIATHRMMSVNQEQIGMVWPFLHHEPPELLDWLPWNHVFGNSHNLGMVVRYGGTMWINDGRPVPGGFDATLANLRDVQPTIYFDVPKSYELLIPHLEAQPDLAAHFFGRLRLMFYSGAALAPPLWHRLEELAQTYAPRPVHMVSSWGLTETAPAILMVHQANAPAGCIGTPLPGLELKLVPSDGKSEARVRGPSITPGYWRDPAATRAAFDADGFFCTGDALKWVDEAKPEAGFRFDGRLTEDFKLSSGTRVNAGELRIRAMTALNRFARDLLVVGENREEIGLLLIPHDHQRAELSKDELPPRLAAELQEALAALNKGVAGSSRQIRRMAFLMRPLSLDAGEITDKGSLNLKTILRRRGDELARLYEGSNNVICAS